ncbi:hypothetical protein [Kineosporia sp. R_H_3]|uniref:hypothetical protein n=1 Tax=Kineosporia sp. R_H_3 TaxID=1961848 RepID=UPI00117B437A|nr:hypothetical protein [Kineosporia sp. R_H_3]
MHSVDFVVNCYERTYREVLAPGYVSGLAEAQRFPFASVTVLVNNVDDRADAEARAKELGEADPGVSRVEFVADHLLAALAVTGLRARHLEPLGHFTDCGLVAATLPGPEWLCYWDADARLREPADWLTPTLAAMDADPRHGVGNPNNWHPGLAEREALIVDGDVAVGYGFSDVAFLARRADLARPVYRKVSPASWRYPLAHVEPVFEQRVDAWMRRERRTRVTYLPAVVEHLGEAGGNYPAGGVRERVRRAAFRRAGRAAAAVSSHPAARAWPRQVVG